MTQKDKELLIKDLCARLPYGVKVKLGDNPNIFDLEYRIKFAVMYGDSDDKLEDILDITNIKPYLFPMSSMTDRQKNLFSLIVCKLDDSDIWRNGDMIFIDNETDLDSLLDFYNKNHLDWRGLIPKGLALDATGKNIY